VVHFNNGMHGWGYTEDQFKRYFPEMVDAIERNAPHAKLIWSSITPVRKDRDGNATNARIARRNAIAAEFATAKHITVDDQHFLMSEHTELHSDDVHFNAAGSALQALQVAQIVMKMLR
jgi:lysophospholipase L1-like esterase